MKYLPTLALLILAVGCSTIRDTDNARVVNRGQDKDRWWDTLPRDSWSGFSKVPQSQDWFEVYEVSAGVFAIYEPGQFEEVVSYLIVGSTRALLFDTGLGIADIHALARELTDLPVLVLNSHSHYDHIGGNHAFNTILGRDTTYTLGRSLGIPHQDVSEFVGTGWIWKDPPTGFEPEKYRIRAFNISQFVADGERVYLGDKVLEVVFTPGHSPDSICLLDRDNRILFTGDTFYPAPLYAHLEGSDFGLYLGTAHKLADLRAQIDTLMPGHNETGLDAGYLLQMRDAFDAIAAGKADYVVTDGSREYGFEGFSIITE